MNLDRLATGGPAALGHATAHVNIFFGNLEMSDFFLCFQHLENGKALIYVRKRRATMLQNVMVLEMAGVHNADNPVSQLQCTITH